MKISNTLPQFKDDRTLIVVAGAQAATFFFAHSGEIDEIQDMRIDEPKYSDREGFFTKSGHGDRFASGSVYEDKSNKVRIDFLNEFASTLKEISKSYDINKVYLFAPQHLLNDTKEAMPYGVKELCSDTYSGNFAHYTAFELLGKIK